MSRKFTVVGIGELLWDLFPEGKRLGGAPLNFCYHAQQLGAESYPVSAIGADDLGMEILDRLSVKGMADDFVEEDADWPTGTVGIVLDGQGKPTYEIHEGVAWDALPMSGKLEVLAQKTDAVCFGSLAQRNPLSRSTIHAFLRAMRPSAIRIFDVNLRQKFYSNKIIDESLRHANILKLSDEELPMLAEMFGLSGTVQDRVSDLMDRFGLMLIAYTRGADGSLLVALDEISGHPGYPVAVADSVGAGDSFTAALCMGLLNSKSLDEINEHANRVAAFVCSQAGATPALPKELVNREWMQDFEPQNARNDAEEKKGS